ncbi:hypothetical protein [Salipaludibacillus aurantiacus]|uniref:hypothetical protein n=1 Tax=Salipaludibacillus aurantiacus TaxID=1601833 RepID=UPI0015A72116|nr:hypothetical protein [Salipaludibacillus aurantiacus]
MKIDYGLAKDFLRGHPSKKVPTVPEIPEAFQRSKEVEPPGLRIKKFTFHHTLKTPHIILENVVLVRKREFKEMRLFILYSSVIKRAGILII